MSLTIVPGPHRDVLGYLVVALLLLGCRPGGIPPGERPAGETAEPQGPVSVELERATYQPGDPVQLTLTNHGTTTYGYNACTRTLERRVEGAWQPVDEPGRICTMEIRLLEGSARQSATTELPADLQPGEYRLLLSLSAEDARPAGDGGIQAASSPFQVT